MIDKNNMKGIKRDFIILISSEIRRWIGPVDSVISIAPLVGAIPNTDASITTTANSTFDTTLTDTAIDTVATITLKLLSYLNNSNMNATISNASAAIPTTAGTISGSVASTTRSNQRITIICDSLNNLIIFNSLQFTCSLLNYITSLTSTGSTDSAGSESATGSIRFIGIHHKIIQNTAQQFTTPDFQAVLQDIFACHINLSQPPQQLGIIAGKGVGAALVKKVSGKIQKERYSHAALIPPLYQFLTLLQSLHTTNNSFTYTQTENSITYTLSQKQKKEIKKQDPTLDLSFNLSLTQRQKDQRGDVVLPYIRQTEVGIVSEVKTTKHGEDAKGVIHYVADKLDDFDSDDSDLDLDLDV